MDLSEGHSLFSHLTPVFCSAQSSGKRDLRVAERAASRNLLLTEGSSSEFSSQGEARPSSMQRVAGRKRLRAAYDSSEEGEDEELSEGERLSPLAESWSGSLQLQEDSDEGDSESDDGDDDDDVTYMGTTKVPRGPPPVWAQTFLTQWLVPVVREYVVASADQSL
jgi:hypothetical protein